MPEYRVEVPVSQAIVYLMQADSAAQAQARAQAAEANGNREGNWYYTEEEKLWERARTELEDEPGRDGEQEHATRKL